MLILTKDCGSPLMVASRTMPAVLTARQERHRVQRIARGRRHLIDLVRIERRVNRRGLAIDQFDGALDGHRLFERADFQLQIDRDRLPECDPNPCDLGCLEARARSAHAVSAGLQRGHVIVALGSGGGFVGRSGSVFRYDDCCARYQASGRVRNNA